LKPQDYEAYSNLGAVLFSQSKFEEAEQLLIKSLTLNPANSSGHFNLANIYFNQVRNYYFSLFLPFFVIFYMLVIYGSYLEGKYENAIQYYKNLIDLNAKDAEAYQNLGII